MKTNHITEILDQKNFSELSEIELEKIRSHCAECLRCREAFQAARISYALLKNTSANVAPAPSPYFQAKVLNAWREKQIPKNPVAAFKRWWQASAALVFSMLLIVCGLILFTFIAETKDTVENQKGTTDYNLYSTDAVILDQKTPKELTTEQAFEIIENPKFAPKRK